MLIQVFLAGLFLLVGARGAVAAEELTLAGAIKDALARDLALQNSRTELARAEIGLENARGERFQYSGDLTVGNRYGVMNLLSSLSPYPMNTPLANAMVMARWPVYTGGKIENGISHAESLVQAQGLQVRAAESTVRLKVAEAYWQLKRAQMRFASQQAAVRGARVQLELARAGLQAGRDTVLDVHRLEVALGTGEDALARSEVELAQARLTLSQWLGRPLEDVVLEAPGVDAGEAVGMTAQDVKQELERRTDVLLARQRIRVQELQLALAWADRAPQVDVVSAYQHGNNPFIATVANRDVLSAFVGTWDARLNVSLHVFDHGVIDRQIRARELELKASVAAAGQVERQAEWEIRRAWQGWQLAIKRVEVTRRAEQLAGVYQQRVQARQRHGFAGARELEDAQTRLVQAQLATIDARIEVILARLSLEAAQGRFSQPLVLEKP